MTQLALLFAHGAGAGSAHPWMRGWSQRLAALGAVTPFDYPYMAAGRRAPDRLPKLIDTHRAHLAALRARHAGPVDLNEATSRLNAERVCCSVPPSVFDQARKDDAVVRLLAQKPSAH